MGFLLFLLVLLDIFQHCHCYCYYLNKQKTTTTIIKRFRIKICTRWHDDKARIVAALSVRNAEKSTVYQKKTNAL